MLNWSQGCYDRRIGDIHKRQMENTAIFEVLARATNLKSIGLGYEMEAEDMHGEIFPDLDTSVIYDSEEYWSRRTCEKELADLLFPTI